MEQSRDELRFRSFKKSLTDKIRESLVVLATEKTCTLRSKMKKKTQTK